MSSLFELSNLILPTPYNGFSSVYSQDADCKSHLEALHNRLQGDTSGKASPKTEKESTVTKNH